MLKRVSCDFWGLNEKNYRFYDENGKPVIDNDGNQVVTVDKYFETYGAKSSSGSQQRTAMFYLGKERKNDDLIMTLKAIKERQKLKA